MHAPRHLLLALLLPAIVWSACGSDETAPASQPLPEASAEAEVDSATDTGADAEADSSPEADAPDVADATQEPIQDAAREQEPAFDGPPWFGCTSEPEAPDAVVVTAFDLADQYFGPEDRRTIEAQVALPDAGDWDRIDAVLDLACPQDGDCDNWDRLASVSLVEGAGTSNEETFELLRYVTPYDTTLCFRADVSAFAPRLKGTKTLRSFLDTWVGPASTGQGHGWRVSLRFVFHPSTGGPAQGPLEVIPLWQSDLEVGNPDNPVSAQVPTKTVAVAPGVTRAELRVLATGHGQGNRSNCAEFCQLVQRLEVNGQPFTFNPWRSDCGANPIGPKQHGTWKYARNGWCPGAVVVPQVLDISDAIGAGQDNTFSYDITSTNQSAYENTCRPGAGDASNQCPGCVFSSSPGNCDYNGGNHTRPFEKVSVELVLYP